MTDPVARYAGMTSYYAATAHPTHDRPRLAGHMRADVCIVGGGFTGLSAALQIVAHGMSVILLEAERVGWGASGRNGGQLIHGYSRSLDVIGKRYGADAERGLGAMALEGGRMIRERVAEHGIVCDLVDGGFVAALNARQMKDLRAEVDVWARHGHDAPYIVERDAVGSIVRSERYVGGLVDPAGGHFHPLNFLLGEAAAFERAGGVIHEHSRVTVVEHGARPVVRTEHGSVAADIVILCGNAYLDDTVAPELTARVMPVSSQIIVTEPLGDRAQELLPGNFCVEDSNYILDYYRRTADDRMLYGGGVVYGGQDPASIAGKIRPNMLKTFPGLADVRIDYAWSGLFALTLTRIPQIGRLASNVYFSHGDSGHGVTTTQLLGRLLGEAVRGQLERFDLFAGLRYHPFPGGRAFRVPLSVLGSWYYSIRDRIGI